MCGLGKRVGTLQGLQKAEVNLTQPVLARFDILVHKIAGLEAAEDPLDGGELAGLMQRVLESDELAEEMRERGQRRALLFSWRRSAEETLGLYREVVADE